MSAQPNAELSLAPELQHFSSAYDSVELWVTPTDNDFARVNEELYGKLAQRAKGQPATGTPVFARFPTRDVHFELHPNDSVPLDTLELPFRRVDDADILPPSDEHILVATPRHTVRLLRMHHRGDTTLES